MMQNCDFAPGIILSTRNMNEGTSAVPSVLQTALERGVRSFALSQEAAEYLSAHCEREAYQFYDAVSLIDLTNGAEAGAAVKARLRNCGVAYLDNLILDDVCEGTILSDGRDLMDIISTLGEMVQSGLVRSLGFGFAGMDQTLRSFLGRYGSHFSFCAIQLNYMDWFLQKAWEKVKTLREASIDIVGRNPLRDSMLKDIDERYLADLKSPARPEQGVLEWAFHWLQGGRADAVIIEPQDLTEMKKILEICSKNDPLDANEEATAYYVAGRIRRIEESIYCSGCLHCQDQCPAGLDVRYLMQLLVDLEVQASATLLRQYRALPEHMKASACIMCGQCFEFCRKIENIPYCMATLNALAGE